MARELILKLGKKITDRVDVKLGMTKLDENSPEYYGLASVVTDEMAELALAMKVRVPTTPAEIGKKVGKDPVYVEQLFDQMSMIGLLEYNWENADHHKQWTLPIFVPGSAELMNMNLQQVEAHPEIAQFFERMSFLPLTKITCMVPPGGAGVGMHVIPVEKAIPATNESVDVEHISHWLKKYEDQLGVGYCSCRNAMRIQGEGCGELQDEMCIAVGQFGDYCLETGKGREHHAMKRRWRSSSAPRTTAMSTRSRTSTVRIRSSPSATAALGSCYRAENEPAVQHAEHVRLRLPRPRRCREVRRLRQVRRGLPGRRRQARPEAVHQDRPGDVSEAATAGRQPLGRAHVEPEL